MPLRILLVDDDPDALLSMRDALGHAWPEAQVRTATSAPEALAQIQRERPDVLVSDYRMAPMDGVRLAAELERITPRLPVILVTAYPEPSGHGPATRNVRAWLAKPFGLDELARAVRGALRDAMGYSGV